VSISTNRFVYDGWNLVAELDHQNNVLRSYTWGQDLSGGTALNQQNAGGVGGLLLVRDHGASTTHFAGYDGNGNVTALVKTDGSISARYEYSPFGEPIRSTGPLAKTNPFRWSTRFTDEESGFVYYGYRYYSPVLGRWIGRDPIGEKGGNNLYAFVLNDPTCSIDFAGEKGWKTFGALVDAVVQLGLAALGMGPEDGMTSVSQSIQESLDAGGEKIVGEAVPGGKGKPKPPKKMFFFGGDWNVAKERVERSRLGGAKTKALKAIGAFVYIMSDQPEADAASFAKNVLDNRRNVANGDLAFADRS